MRSKTVPRSLLVGLWTTAAVTAIAIFGPLLLPHGPDRQLDPIAASHLPPGSRIVVVELADGDRLAVQEAKVADGTLRLRRADRWTTVPVERLAGASPETAVESRIFPLGTDRYGRDLLARLVHGARVSLRVGLAVVLVALLLGVAVGSLAGLGGRLVDRILMRISDLFLAFPRLFLVLALAALWRAGEWTVIAVLAATGWMEVARLIRGEVLRLRDTDLARAARAGGATRSRLAFFHLLPLAVPPVLVNAALRVGDTILVEATMSFLGFGVQPPTPSWGNMIADGVDVLLEAWWVSVFPGLAIVVTVLGFGLVADGLRDRLDPHRRDTGSV